jgi:hypothetical protein
MVSTVITPLLTQLHASINVYLNLMICLSAQASQTIIRCYQVDNWFSPKLMAHADGNIPGGEEIMEFLFGDSQRACEISEALENLKLH